MTRVCSIIALELRCYLYLKILLSPCSPNKTPLFKQACGCLESELAGVCVYFVLGSVPSFLPTAFRSSRSLALGLSFGGEWRPNKGLNRGHSFLGCAGAGLSEYLSKVTFSSLPVGWGLGIEIKLICRKCKAETSRTLPSGGHNSAWGHKETKGSLNLLKAL